MEDWLGGLGVGWQRATGARRPLRLRGWEEAEGWGFRRGIFSTLSHAGEIGGGNRTSREPGDRVARAALSGMRRRIPARRSQPPDLCACRRWAAGEGKGAWFLLDGVVALAAQPKGEMPAFREAWKSGSKILQWWQAAGFEPRLDSGGGWWADFRPVAGDSDPLFHRSAPSAVAGETVRLSPSRGWGSGGEDGIRTRGTPFGVHRFSKPAQSTTLPPLRAVESSQSQGWGRVKRPPQGAVPIPPPPARTPRKPSAPRRTRRPARSWRTPQPGGSRRLRVARPGGGSR